MEHIKEKMDSIQQAQHDMRASYSHGYAGVIVSGIMWGIAGLIVFYVSPTKGIWALLIGGMFIHPLGIVFNKILGASGNHSSNNPLGKLAMEGTFFMIMCLPLAYGLSLQNEEWFFQAMLLIIGGRYLTFATLFGTRSFWILGGTLGVAAYLLFSLNLSAHVSALTGSSIELIFGTFMLIKTRSST
jgi:hypothetical protein